MMNRKTAVLMLAAFAGALATAAAIEIPLESFGKGTKVAYVNMHKIFEAYPETEKARLELTALVEEKRSEISAKKEEIAKLKGEIDFLNRQQSSVDPESESRKPAEQAAPVEIPEDPSSETPADPPADSGVAQTPAPQGATSLTLPENSPLKFLFSPPAESTSTDAADLEPEVSTDSEKAKLFMSTTAPRILPGIPSLKPQMEDKQAALARKQADLEAFVGATEQEIKNLEEGKTMTLLARIYQTLGEIANKDGYTIIVDKNNILYGENTVDITENVIWRLSNPGKRR